jgi:hypothetical protein
MSIRFRFTQCMALAALLAICAGPAAVAGGGPGQSSATGSPAAVASKSKSLQKHLPRNKHLHLSQATINELLNAATKGSKHRKHHPPRHPTSTISGFVHSASGSGASGVSVRLAKANGKKIRNARARHTTTSRINGGYIMHAVKAGRYRVVASKVGAGSGHKVLTVKAHHVHHADVKLAVSKPKKHRKK